MHFFCIFFAKNLHISKKSITFAQNFKSECFTYSRLGKIHKCLIKIIN